MSGTPGSPGGSTYAASGPLTTPGGLIGPPETTQELYDLYSVEDPALKLERLQENRHARLCSQQIVAPSITSSPAAIQQSQNLLRNIRQFKHLPEPDAEEGSPTVPCPHCNRTFVSDHDLRLHTAKSHPGKVARYVPRSFDRAKHSVNGVPTCRACQTSFKQWPGLMSHLLSGACPNPQRLQEMDEDAEPSALLAPLERVKQAIADAPRHSLPKIASSQDAQDLASQCLQCGFWTPNYTKLVPRQEGSHEAVGGPSRPRDQDL